MANPLMLCVEVEDLGVGLSVEQRKPLFQPFKQAQRRAGGTGLGLFALAKRVESLNGRYGVSGRRDNQTGSRFWFTLPYRPDETMAVVASSCDRPSGHQSPTQSHRKRGDSAPPPCPGGIGNGNGVNDNYIYGGMSGNYMYGGSGEVSHSDVGSGSRDERVHSSGDEGEGRKGRELRILLVDDSTLIQKTITRALQTQGCTRVDVAPNGLECLKMTEKTKYDLILMVSACEYICCMCCTCIFVNCSGAL
jgi:CheY-like chemotaxis protein